MAGIAETVRRLNDPRKVHPSWGEGVDQSLGNAASGIGEWLKGFVHDDPGTKVRTRAALKPMTDALLNSNEQDWANAFLPGFTTDAALSMPGGTEREQSGRAASVLASLIPGGAGALKVASPLLLAIRKAGPNVLKHEGQLAKVLSRVPRETLAADELAPLAKAEEQAAAPYRGLSASGATINGAAVGGVTGGVAGLAGDAAVAPEQSPGDLGLLDDGGSGAPLSAAGMVLGGLAGAVSGRHLAGRKLARHGAEVAKAGSVAEVLRNAADAKRLALPRHTDDMADDISGLGAYIGAIDPEIDQLRRLRKGGGQGDEGASAYDDFVQRLITKRNTAQFAKDRTVDDLIKNMSAGVEPLPAPSKNPLSSLLPIEQPALPGQADPPLSLTDHTPATIGNLQPRRQGIADILRELAGSSAAESSRFAPAVEGIDPAILARLRASLASAESQMAGRFESAGVAGEKPSLAATLEGYHGPVNKGSTVDPYIADDRGFIAPIRPRMPPFRTVDDLLDELPSELMKAGNGKHRLARRDRLGRIVSDQQMQSLLLADLTKPWLDKLKPGSGSGVGAALAGGGLAAYLAGGERAGGQ